MKEQKMPEELSDKELDAVSGGRMRQINNSNASYANLRDSKGEVVGRIYNGEWVDTTGATENRGGYKWYEVEYDGDYYWVVGSFIGY